MCILSPLLWILSLDSLLRTLTPRRIKVTAYDDDVAILISAKFLQAISEIKESALKHVMKWTKASGMVVNQTKTELMLFANRRKLETFKLGRKCLGNDRE